MSLSEEQRIKLSQLVDGELSIDEANRVLANVLGDLSHALNDASGAKQLYAMLQLRQALGAWRRQEPPKTMVTLPAVQRGSKTSRVGWNVVGLATAALLGGILVGGGFFVGSHLTGQQSGKLFVQSQPGGGADEANRPAIVVTPQQQRDIAEIFALHESVAGPLNWYAADDATIQIAPAEKGELMRQPIAIVLRLIGQPSSSGEIITSKTYVVVCRDRNAATIELPESAMAPKLRMRILSTDANGQVKLQYVLAADGTGRGREETALVGRRSVGLSQTTLGQLAFDDRIVNVDASAWVFKSPTE